MSHQSLSSLRAKLVALRGATTPEEVLDGIVSLMFAGDVENLLTFMIQEVEGEMLMEDIHEVWTKRTNN